MQRPRPLPPLAALRAFAAAARHLSFRKAAEDLGVTPTAVSHQIRLLEASLGVALFTRQVRRVTLTEAGRILYPAVRDGFDGVERAVAAVTQHRSRRAVTLSATTLFTARRLLPALGRFRSRHPDITLRLHACDAVADLRAGTADIAVRYGAGPFGGLVAEPLLAERFGVLCSPALGIAGPDDLRRATLIHAEWSRPDLAPDWRRWAALAGSADLARAASLRLTDDGHVLQAALAGHGVAIASLVLARSEIEAGLLVHPFGPEIAGETYHCVALPEALARGEVQAVRDWLRLEFRESDAPPVAEPG